MARYVRAHVFISGRVQGVFFRANARREALRLGVKGWIRNLYDGRVEAVIEGEEDKVKMMVEWCKRGPPGAIVSKVEIFWEPYKGEYKSFDIIW
jgi:acylphosphatase